MEESPVVVESGLSFIEVKTDNPFDLFNSWYEEVRESDVRTPEALTLATSNKDGRVSARTLLLSRLDEDGFVVVSDRRSTKCNDLAEVPRFAVVFAWFYEKEGREIWKQVRAEGRVVELDPSEVQPMYDGSPLFCKIRAHLCDQGQAVDWPQLKQEHDLLLKEVQEEGRPLPMPDHYVGYKLIPDLIDFYFTERNRIADRALFLKTSDGVWKNHKIAA